MEIFLSNIIFLENCVLELWFKLSCFSPHSLFSSERDRNAGRTVLLLSLTTDQKLQNEGVEVLPCPALVNSGNITTCVVTGALQV